VEGPGVAVISGFLARLSLIGLPQVYGLLVLADLIGDVVLYALGRRGRVGRLVRLMSVFGLTRKHIAVAIRQFRAKGGRILLLGKLTHSAGFAVLLAAGLVRMPFGRFLILNTLATLPKVAVFLGIGWMFGAVSGGVENLLFRLSLGLAVLIGTALAFFLLRKRVC
jgi:membrane-associated protein